MAEIRKCFGDAIVTQAAILTSHAEDQFRDFTSNGRSSWIEAVLRAVELVRDQLAKPGQDGVGLDSSRYRFETSTSEPLPMTARVERSGSVSRRREARWARRILFSASRYSFCNRNC
jgi:hypothetical protein